MLSKEKYYCKIFLMKDLEFQKLEILISKLIKREEQYRSWVLDEIKIGLNEDKDNILDNIEWNFYLEILPLDNAKRNDYIEQIKILMKSLRDNGFLLYSKCDFENELPKYNDLNFELAYEIYPLPNGIVYYKNDLMEEKNLERLFSLCKLLEGIIYKVGWDFLIKHYGYEKIYEINKKCNWFDVNSIKELEENVKINMSYCEGDE